MFLSTHFYSISNVQFDLLAGLVSFLCALYPLLPLLVQPLFLLLGLLVDCCHHLALLPEADPCQSEVVHLLRLGQVRLDPFLVDDGDLPHDALGGPCGEFGEQDRRGIEALQPQGRRRVHGNHGALGVVEEVGGGIVGEAGGAEVEGHCEHLPEEDTPILFGELVIEFVLDLQVVEIVMVLEEVAAADVDLAIVHQIEQLVLDVVGLPQRPEVEFVGLAELFLVLRPHPLPVHVQQGLVVSRLGEELALDLDEVVVLLFVDPQDLVPDALGGQHADEGDHGALDVEDLAGDDCLGVLGVEGEAAHLEAQVGDVAVLVQGIEEEELADGLEDGLLLWVLDVLEVDHIADPHRLQGQDHIVEGDPQDLRQAVVFHLIVELLAVQPQAFALLRPPRPPLPLDRLHLRNRHRHQGVHVRLRVVLLLLHKAAVDHEPDVVDGQRSLRDVGRKHHLPNLLGSLLEHLGLVFVTQGAIQLVHDHAWHILPLLHQVRQLILAHPRGRLALLGPGQEDQDVAGPLVQVHADGGPHHFLDAGTVVDGVELHIDRVEFAVHLDNWAAAVIAGEGLGVQGSARDNELESAFAILHCLLDERKEHISVQ